MSLHLAYDGSTHADWLSHYAARMAAELPERELRVLHVEEPDLPRAALDARLERLEQECALQSVTVRILVLPRHGDVGATLLEALPAGPDHHVVCGTRVSLHERGYLAGTVSEQLLRAHPCHVLGIRVLQPGYLGAPRELLLPLAGHPRGFCSGLPFLRLLAPGVQRIHLLAVRSLSRLRFRSASMVEVDRLRAEGRDYLDRVTEELRGEPALARCAVAREVVVSDDVPKEIALAASRLRTELIYLGAPERSLPAQFAYGNPVEQVLRNAPCDVAIYRGLW